MIFFSSFIFFPLICQSSRQQFKFAFKVPVWKLFPRSNFESSKTQTFFVSLRIELNASFTISRCFFLNSLEKRRLSENSEEDEGKESGALTWRYENTNQKYNEHLNGVVSKLSLSKWASLEIFWVNWKNDNFLWKSSTHRQAGH